jgi:hypothetical protein
LGFELIKHYNNEKAFNSCLCFPRLGVATTFWNFDNREILGYALTSVFFVEPFFGAGRRFSYSFRAGFGPVYATNPFDKTKKPLSLSYSKRLSFALMAASTINLKLTDRIFKNLSANYNHISNGGMREPNKGINYPTLSIGLDFSVSRRFSLLNALNLGVAFINDRSHREEMKRADVNGVDHMKAGLLAGNEFLLGRFIFCSNSAFRFTIPISGTGIYFSDTALIFYFLKSCWPVSG